MRQRRKKDIVKERRAIRRGYYPRSALKRIGPNRYYLNVPGDYIDLDRVPPGFTVNAYGELSKRRKRRRVLHRRSR